MKIIGIGTLFSGGRGIDAFQQALAKGWQAPSPLACRDRTLPAYQVDLDGMADRTVLKKLRRADKLSKIAVVAASDAVADSGLGAAEQQKMGVIVATAFGAHATTFAFLDGILEYGDAAVSPTIFSNSVHNAAASYISSALAIQGPTLTVTQFFFSFQAALQLADAWLREGRVEDVLVGAVDQVGEVMGYIAASRLAIARDGRIKPFVFSPAEAVPGEGAAFFVMSSRDRGSAYCTVDGLRFHDDLSGPVRSDLDILDADGLSIDESSYISSLVPGVPAAAYAPLYGSMMIGSAFSCAAGALLLKEQRCFASPVPDNPRGLAIVREPADSSIEFIRCIRYNCSTDRAVIELKKA